MTVFETYIDSLPQDQKSVLGHYVELVSEIAPEAEQGYSYSFPSFKYLGRPLIGFGYKEGKFSVYPFDPKIIEAVSAEIDDHESGKGYIRFTKGQLLKDEIIVLIVELRQAYLKSQG